MARITVAYEALERGQFPQVCCKTGVHTDNYVRWRFVQTPAWTWILLPFGFIPFLIARMFATQQFDGVLPMQPDVVRRLNRLRYVVLVSLILGVVALVAALSGASALAYAGFALIAVAGVALIAGSVMSPDCRRDLQRGAAELSSVHKRFVGTIQAAWAQADDQRGVS